MPMLRWRWRTSSNWRNDKYASDYPANVGPHMTNTDSSPFMNLPVPQPA